MLLGISIYNNVIILITVESICILENRKYYITKSNELQQLIFSFKMHMYQNKFFYNLFKIKSHLIVINCFRFSFYILILQ